MSNESIRQRKVADSVQKLVSVVIDRRVKDPDKGFVTVTKVRMTRDLKIASVYFTVLGDEEQRDRSLEVLTRAKSYIRSEIGPELKMRFTPELRFFIDDTMEQAQRIDELIASIKKEESED